MAPTASAAIDKMLPQSQLFNKAARFAPYFDLAFVLWSQVRATNNLDNYPLFLFDARARLMLV
jgi:hypothetical protein